MYNNVVCDRSLEPDEIIWENLAYTKTNQKIRSHLVKFIAIIFVAMGIIITL